MRHLCPQSPVRAAGLQGEGYGAGPGGRGALLLIGIAGFVLANGATSHDDSAFAEDYAALDDRDPTTTADSLDARVTEVSAAFDDYVAAADEVRTRHEAVTNAFNDALATPGGTTSARFDNAMAHTRGRWRARKPFGGPTSPS